MKKNLKKKISSYGFWISFLTVIFLIVQNILKNYGVIIPNDVAIEIIGGIIFILVTFGVITNSKKEKITEIKEDIQNEIDNTNIEDNK